LRLYQGRILLYTQAFVLLLRLYEGFTVLRLCQGSMQAHAAQHTAAVIQALFRLYQVSLKGAFNTQVFVAFFVSMGMILWLWRKEVCPNVCSRMLTYAHVCYYC
jgi:hypothetical protein